MDTPLKKLFIDFTESYVDSPDFVIDFYNQNIIIIKNTTAFKDKEELKIYIELTCRYIQAVYAKDHFNETIDKVDGFISFIDKEINRLNSEDLKDDFYYSLSFHKGMASYNLRDYKTASLIFKNLMTIDSKNDTFKIWLNYSRYGERLWLVNLIYVFAAICLFSDIFISDFSDDWRVTILIPAVGIIALIGNWIYQTSITRSYRKMNKKQE
jgi:hypothetical protein